MSHQPGDKPSEGVPTPPVFEEMGDINGALKNVLLLQAQYARGAGGISRQMRDVACESLAHEITRYIESMVAPIRKSCSGLMGLLAKAREERDAARSSTRRIISPQEFMWLIEKREHTTTFYWTGTVADGGFWKWTADAHEAARFPNKAAAEGLRLRLKLYNDYPEDDHGHLLGRHNNCASVEHGFIYAPPSATGPNSVLLAALNVIAGDAPKQEDSIHGPRLRCQHCGHAWRLNDNEPEHHGVGCAYVTATEALRRADGGAQTNG